MNRGSSGTMDAGTKPPLLDEPKFVILAYVMYNILVLLQKTDESIFTSLMLTIDGERQ